MKFMDKLPTVISCCFCCFLRAGTVLIAIFSFVVGILFAPNVSHSHGYWDLNPVLSNYSVMTETTVQMTLGVASIMLCAVSVLLLIGACCNLPILIEIYQWGAIMYSATVVLMFFILATFCFFVHANCIIAGTVLCALIVCDVLCSEVGANRNMKPIGATDFGTCTFTGKSLFYLFLSDGLLHNSDEQFEDVPTISIK